LVEFNSPALDFGTIRCQVQLDAYQKLNLFPSNFAYIATSSGVHQVESKPKLDETLYGIRKRWSFAPKNHSRRAMLRAGDGGVRVLAADNLGTSADDTYKQEACAGGVVLDSTTSAMLMKDDTELSELDLDLKKILDGCDCWSPDAILDPEEQAVDMPSLVNDESAEFKCQDEDVTSIFQRLEYEETTVVVKQRKISMCDKTMVKRGETGHPTPYERANDRGKMTREERQALRKENNKKSAFNSRKRKREELLTLQEQNAALHEEVETWKKRVAELESENEQYKKTIAKLNSLRIHEH